MVYGVLGYMYVGREYGMSVCMMGCPVAFLLPSDVCCSSCSSSRLSCPSWLGLTAGECYECGEEERPGRGVCAVRGGGDGGRRLGGCRLVGQGKKREDEGLATVPGCVTEERMREVEAQAKTLNSSETM